MQNVFCLYPSFRDVVSKLEFRLKLSQGMKKISLISARISLISDVEIHH